MSVEAALEEVSPQVEAEFGGVENLQCGEDCEVLEVWVEQYFHHVRLVTPLHHQSVFLQQ